MAQGWPKRQKFRSRNRQFVIVFWTSTFIYYSALEINILKVLKIGTLAFIYYLALKVKVLCFEVPPGTPLGSLFGSLFDPR